ncbi:hypothetical protein JOB18_029921 [Solea senegalensis]|uniref:Uncharacterized protein n=1 Tax=Solea senegalensis TaxID=28829 RepID=A0AAV6T070_SOLSE|nr:hypothetical protein JOB18_029921 [Solea senegalensis]
MATPPKPEETIKTRKRESIVIRPQDKTVEPPFHICKHMGNGGSFCPLSVFCPLCPGFIRPPCLFSLSHGQLSLSEVLRSVHVSSSWTSIFKLESIQSNHLMALTEHQRGHGAGSGAGSGAGRRVGMDKKTRMKSFNDC